MPPIQLSTTSYAILGYLAVRPWSAYELAKQMGRTLHHFWPRAESGIYREVKRLEEAGLATARDDAVGRRARTEYDITDAGRTAVARWLDEPRTRGGFLESEGLVRVLLADIGSKEALLATLTTMRADAGAISEQMEELLRAYLAGGGQFMERAHVNILIGRFLIDLSAMVDEWSRWAEGFVGTWDDARPRPPDEATFEEYRRALGQALG
jgi:DNA-binding PadR family transcriptional regulator